MKKAVIVSAVIGLAASFSFRGVVPSNEEELFNLGHITHEVGSFVHKNQGAIEQGAQTVGDIVSGNYVGAVSSGIKTVDDATNQLFNLGHITHEVGSFVNKNKDAIEAGAQTVGDIATGNYVGAVDSGITTVDDATHQNELFNLGHITHEVGSFVNKNKDAIEAGAQTVGDIATGNYVGAVDSGIKTVDDTTNQLFSLKKIGKEVGNFVNKNQKTIEAGAQTVGDVVTGNYVGAVDNGIKTVNDATHH